MWKHPTHANSPSPCSFTPKEPLGSRTQLANFCCFMNSKTMLIQGPPTTAQNQISISVLASKTEISWNKGPPRATQKWCWVKGSLLINGGVWGEHQSINLPISYTACTMCQAMCWVLVTHWWKDKFPHSGNLQSSGQDRYTIVCWGEYLEKGSIKCYRANSKGILCGSTGTRKGFPGEMTFNLRWQKAVRIS